MRVELIHDPGMIWGLKDSWMEILSEIPDRHPFLTPHWMAMSFEYFVTDEKLTVALVKDDFGKLMGIFPFILRNTEDGKSLGFTPHASLTPYVDLIVSQKIRKPALISALRLIKAEENNFYISLKGLKETSPSIWTLEQVVDGLGMESQKSVRNEAYYLELPESIEEVLYKGHGKIWKKMQSVYKKMERGDYRIEIFENIGDVDDHFGSFWRLIRLLGNENLITPGKEAFLREVFMLFAREGWIKLFIVRSDGWRISAGAVFDYDDTYYLYLHGYDPEAEEAKPVHALLLAIIYNAIQNRKRKLEVVEENELIKGLSTFKRIKVYKFLARQRELVNASVD